MIYLDNNAATPCDPLVVEAMLPYFTTKFGNAASRTHPYGWVADEAVSIARKQIADLIHAEESEIIFTSGATESCNLAIKGVYEAYSSKGNHIITCATEHKAVLDTCAYLEKKGASITYLPVDMNGNINLSELEAAITPQTILIALMFANNETGVIHPIETIAEIAYKHNVLFFTDATQAVGKININIQANPIALMAMSAHKFYGPKGIGALYIRRKSPRAKPTSQMNGGGHQNGFRSGTLNVPSIIGMGTAATLCIEKMHDEMNRLQTLRNELIDGFRKIAHIKINGDINYRLPNVANISFEGYKAERLIHLLNTKIAFSVGSACTAASQQPSHVLAAMGLSKAQIDGSIRLSLGRFNTQSDIVQTITYFSHALAKESLTFNNN